MQNESQDLSFLLKDMPMQNQNFASAQAIQFNPSDFQQEMELLNKHGESSK